MHRSLVKKAKVNKAKKFASLKHKYSAFAEWRFQVTAMKRIRGDKLLWQAHSTNSQFFTVSVKVGATVDYKRSHPVARQHHLLVPQTDNTDVAVASSGEQQGVLMGLGNMISIKLD